MRYRKLAFLTAFLALLAIGAGEVPPEEKALRMTKEQLKPMLGSKDLVVIDMAFEGIDMTADTAHTGLAPAPQRIPGRPRPPP